MWCRMMRTRGMLTTMHGLQQSMQGIICNLSPPPSPHTSLHGMPGALCLKHRPSEIFFWPVIIFWQPSLRARPTVPNAHRPATTAPLPTNCRSNQACQLRSWRAPPRLLVMRSCCQPPGQRVSCMCLWCPRASLISGGASSSATRACGGAQRARACIHACMRLGARVSFDCFYLNTRGSCLFRVVVCALYFPGQFWVAFTEHKCVVGAIPCAWVQFQAAFLMGVGP